MSGKVFELSQTDFEEKVLQSEIPVVVLFWAPWCDPCRYAMPVIDELAEKIDAKKALFFKVNTDENQTLAMKFGIRSIPTMIIFDKGEIISQEVGAKPFDEMRVIVDDALANHTV